MNKLPNINIADSMTIDSNGIYWIYLKEREIFLINKDGTQIIPFDTLDKETLEDILKKEPNEKGIIFNDGEESYSIEDLIYKKE